MGEASSSVGGRWRLRTVPEHLVDRYRAEGWWTDATLGTMVAEGLADHGRRRVPRPLEGAALAGHLRRRRPRGPVAGRRAARAGRRAGDVVLFQLPNWVEAGITFWAAAYLGAVVVPVVHFYGAKEVDYILRATAPDVIVTADRFGHNDYRRDLRRAARRPARAAVAGRRQDPTTRRCRRAPHAFESLARRRADRRPAAGRPRRAGHHRVHLGHDARPEGRRPLAPHDRVRDPPARVTASRRAGRRRSPARRSVTSSACSTRSSSRCCGCGR